MIVEQLQTGIGTRALDDIRVDAISDHEWRICDRRIPRNDARSLLGFIEHTHDSYEVMEFTDPVRFSFCTSLDDAVARFVRTATASTKVLVRTAPKRDAAILRYPLRPRSAP